MPTSALAAPTEMAMVASVRARAPRPNSNTTGTSRKSTSCLVSGTLTAGSRDNAADSSVSAA